MLARSRRSGWCSRSMRSMQRVSWAASFMVDECIAAIWCAVPDSGKQLTEFSRTNEDSYGLDLKIIKWGTRGQDALKYTSAVPGDIIQTFRNFTSAVVDANNRIFNRRDSVLILLDEFDVIKDKSGLVPLSSRFRLIASNSGSAGSGRTL